MLSLKRWMIKVSEAIHGLQKTEQANITLPTGYTNHGEIRNFYQRKGSICEVGFDLTPPGRVNQDVIVTLPSSCCPLRALRYSYFPGMRSSDDDKDHYVIINTDGRVQYTGSGRFFFTYTFICKGG